MKLNQNEKAVVTSKGRAWIQSTFEARLLQSLFDNELPKLERTLEIGCGSGNGMQFLKHRLDAQQVVAMDLDEEMLVLSAARWSGADWAFFTEANASQMPFGEGVFDLVAEFAVLHHVPDWQSALAEVARVLKPGGYFLYWDLYRFAICNPISRRLFEHPMENRFSHSEFTAELGKLGLVCLQSRQFPAIAGMGLFKKADVTA
ncbi:class I SAM-dependent methyltransferase [Shewanella litorisediminis]|uniref:Class I SAM-dependent methyltransferase n=1 Tax=Shewanella litorisediminis TaxID=1173586 RepID=A0ABX7FZ61_9GAMM|nr:class I SAM-dependent methyltransferase [Shewanella litorisediminis]MCL2918708.1 class I SAM-dependent methyltransferase [Shewanella litorisediminis]QRH00319.1 class I SAM-dependent methyltransferase [Shewanella litorisediminis]